MLASYFDLWEEIDWTIHYNKSDNKYLPTQILAWGFFTVDWQKMSKTIWNVIEPVEYSNIYSKELLTLYMLSAFPIGNDWDYDRKDAILVYNAKLANNFGNLLNRVVVLTAKLEWSYLTSPKWNWTIGTVDYQNDFQKEISVHNLKWALDETFMFLDTLNKYADVNEPWNLIKTDIEKANIVLYNLAEWLRQVWLNLYCFFPEKMWELFDRLGLEKYVVQLEDWKLDELRNKTEIFNIKKQNWVLFERFDVETSPNLSSQKGDNTNKNINFSVTQEVEKLWLHTVSAIIEIPKVITRRNGSLKKYIKNILENIDFNDSERLAILDEAQKFYDNSGYTEAMHPSVHLQKLVENSWKLPNINNIVDSYNIESLKSGLSIWVHDISKIEWEDITIKISDGTEKFIPLWGKEIIRINSWEYICTDNNWKRVICRMDCKQCSQTLVNKQTKRILIYVQWNDWCTKEYIEKTLEQVVNNLKEFCNAK